MTAWIMCEAMVLTDPDLIDRSIRPRAEVCATKRECIKRVEKAVRDHVNACYGGWEEEDGYGFYGYGREDAEKMARDAARKVTEGWVEIDSRGGREYRYSGADRVVKWRMYKVKIETEEGNG